MQNKSVLKLQIKSQIKILTKLLTKSISADTLLVACFITDNCYDYKPNYGRIAAKRYTEFQASK